MKWLSISLMTIGLVLLGVFGFQYFHSEQAQEASMSEALERIEQGQDAAPAENRSTEDETSFLTSSVTNALTDITSALLSAISHNEEEETEQAANSETDDSVSANESNNSQQAEAATHASGSEDASNSEEKEEVVENSTHANETSVASSFQAHENESFAVLDIPKLGRSLPIIEGTDADSLAKGVGRVASTAYPGEGEQIVLSGHRDTVFRDFGQLEIGDRFIVTTPYGEFEYEMRETEIVDEDDTSVIREMGEEVLVVSTCYPFHLVGTAPERYVIYAYPVS
ncbi:class D sortase [Bacillus daqingensis]|uniref:Class D sortase n=1 Tax=Bacillus daqingensis TaxID=872396 RepID=A0ABV9NWY1_9BACI